MSAGIPELVTFDEAKTWLRVTDTDHDAEIETTREAANDLIYGYLKDRADETWTPTTVPAEIRHAILMLVAYYYERRGDDLEDPDRDTAIWAAVENVVKRRRDPALA
jgi:hypothetical protein